VHTQTKPRIVVIGAGAFGGWTALHLQRRGAQVTLVDAWGPGNARASSGGETRIIRASYGPDQIYVQLVVRALQLWRENEERWQRKLYHRIGCLRMVGADDAYENATVPTLQKAGIAFEVLQHPDLVRRFPQVNFEGVRWAVLESDAGYLKARRACEAVLHAFENEGGTYRALGGEPGRISSGRMGAVLLSDGATLAADQYVFACGPWLGKLFPGVIGDRIKPTRQEVFFFGTPAGDARFSDDALPSFIDRSGPHFYGIPGNQWRGLKLADDNRGPVFDPTTGDRAPTHDGMESARRYLEFRFPGMKGAPLLESRVCQYENSTDGHLIVDRHPEAGNVWLVGGGSGHGFKHGPALSEMVAALVLDDKAPDPFFSLARLDRNR
jgi:glycine/D-amino acid oxidase-like deaminating enzyme